MRIQNQESGIQESEQAGATERHMGWVARNLQRLKYDAAVCLVFPLQWRIVDQPSHIIGALSLAHRVSSTSERPELICPMKRFSFPSFLASLKTALIMKDLLDEVATV